MTNIQKQIESLVSKKVHILQGARYRSK